MIHESQWGAPITASVSQQANTESQQDRRARQWLSRLAIHQITTRRWTLSREIEALRTHDVPAIGIWGAKLEDHVSDVRAVRASGLAVSSLSWLDGLTCGEWDRQCDAVRNGAEMILLGARLGAEVINVVTGIKGTHIRSNAKRLVVLALRELADEAARWNLQLALQPMHRVCKRSWTFLHSIEETMDVISAVDRTCLGMTCNTFHLSRSRSLCRRIREFSTWIRLVQLCDGPRRPRHDHDRRLPGEGELPLAEVVATLEEAGYRGRYEVEVMSPDAWDGPQEELIPLIRERFGALKTASVVGSSITPD